MNLKRVKLSMTFDVMLVVSSSLDGIIDDCPFPGQSAHLPVILDTHLVVIETMQGSLNLGLQAQAPFDYTSLVSSL